MKTQRFILIIVIIAAFSGGLYMIYRATNVQPYEQYPATFQQRGDQLTNERFPKNASDTIFMMQMEQLQFKDEIRHELTENKINWNDIIASIGIILAGIVSVIGLFFKWADGKRGVDILQLKQNINANHDEITNKLNENEKQHKDIFVKLEVVEDLTVRKEIREAFRAIARNYMHYRKGSIPSDLQIIISAQAERLVDLSDQIMSEHFTIDVYDATLIKLDEQCREAWKQVADLLGCDFLVLYKEAQEIATKTFKRKLKNIVTDSEFNGKYDRYKRAGESFLDELIPLTIEQYTKYKQNEVTAKANSI